MRYQCLEKPKKAWPINLMCGVWRVSRSGYDAWLARDLSQQDRSHQELDSRIQAIFAEPQHRYGVPRIAKTVHQEGRPCRENRLTRRMRPRHWRAIQAKKFNGTTDSHHSRPVAPDRLKQDVGAAPPNQQWTTDITYGWPDEGWRYLAVVLDLSSRAIVGWSMNRRLPQHLVWQALTMALFRRHCPKGTILHSDRGSQYGAKG